MVTPKSKTELKIIERGVLGVGSRGVIRFVESLDQESFHTSDHTTGASSSDASALGSLALRERRSVLAILDKQGWELSQCSVMVMPYGQFLCPGLIDTHTHACQVPNVGVGQQYELLDWLSNITFPRERMFADVNYARKTYNSVVQRMIDCGTTTACYFATHHLQASKVLAGICTRRGQRAFVGKCNMDRNAPTDHVETNAAESVGETKAFIAFCHRLHRSTQQKSQGVLRNPEDADPNSEVWADRLVPEFTPEAAADEDGALMQTSLDELMQIDGHANNRPGLEAQPDQALHSRRTDLTSADAEAQLDTLTLAVSLDCEQALVQPILTPRFAISCTDSLLSGLSAISARDPSLRIQTHLSESPGEIEFTKQLFPFARTYTEVYDHFNLLSERTVLAHAIHLEESELRLIEQRKCGISHCPTSNLNLRSGATRLGDMLNRGIKVSLGTDASGGFGVGMLTAVRNASIVSKVLQFAARDNLSLLVPSPLDSSDPRHPSEAKVPAIEVPHAVLDDGDGEAHASNLEQRLELAVPEAHDFTMGPLSSATLLWLATVGGAQVANVVDRTGSLDVGKDFDALLVNVFDADEQEKQSGQREPRSTTSDASYPYRGNPSCFVERGEPVANLVEKFLFTADDRNISHVWVRSRLIGGTKFRHMHGRRREEGVGIGGGGRGQVKRT